MLCKYCCVANVGIPSPSASGSEIARSPLQARTAGQPDTAVRKPPSKPPPPLPSPQAPLHHEVIVYSSKK